MRLFENKFAFLLVLTCMALLFMPKINLVTFGERESAGLRIDDFILLFTAGAIFLASLFQRRRPLAIELWLITLTLFSILSFFTNRLLVKFEVFDHHSNFLYAIRLLEYFVFFYIGALATQFFNLRSIITALFLINTSAIVLQQLGIMGEFGLTGYSSILSSCGRSPGLAAFPSEIGTSLTLMFCFYLYDTNPNPPRFIQQFAPNIQETYKKIFPYALFLLFGIAIILTGSRISILALAFMFLLYLRHQVSLRSPIMLCTIAFILFIFSFGFYHIIQNTDFISSRGAGLFSSSNLYLIQDVWEQIDLTYNPIGNEIIEFENYDMSWWMRIHKWVYVAKIFVLTPESWLQGIGPGFAFAGLDGGFLRILIEYGFIGSWLFWRFFKCIYQIDIQLKWMVIALGINMLTFDAHLAYKPMSLLLFVAGYQAFLASANQRVKTV
jgi:hypothetical protein